MHLVFWKAKLAEGGVLNLAHLTLPGRASAGGFATEHVSLPQGDWRSSPNSYGERPDRACPAVTEREEVVPSAEAAGSQIVLKRHWRGQTQTAVAQEESTGGGYFDLVSPVVTERLWWGKQQRLLALNPEVAKRRSPLQPEQPGLPVV